MFFSTDHDIVETIFNVCSNVAENPGLTLSDVKNKDCMTILESGGVTEDNIENVFFATDANNDNIVNRSEAMDSLKRMNFLRSDGSEGPNTCTSEKVGLLKDRTKYDCSGTESCKSCKDCECPWWGV